MSGVSVTDAVGYLASALVFATFYMRTMTLLRSVAIGSNVAFIGYGYLGGMTPILVLHLLLLPLNLLRLHQTRQMANKVRAATEGDLSFDWLMPHMSHRSFAAGETIFRKGDPARELFLITAGRVRLTELQVEVGQGATVCEIGGLSPHKARTATAVALTSVDALAIAEDRIIALHNVNSEFSFYLVKPTTK